MNPLLLALVSSFCWAGLDTCRKVLSQRLRTSATIIIAIGCSQCLMFVLWGFHPGTLWQLPYLVPALSSILLNIIANLSYMEAVRISSMSRTVPMLSLIPGLAALFSWLLLGEALLWQQSLGIAVVTSGAFLLSRARGAAVDHRGAILMLVTATCWALATTLDKMALEIAGVSTHGAVLAGGVATGILVITAIRGRLGLLAEGWQHRGWLLIAMFAGTLALALQLYTYQFMYVGIFESIKRTFGLSSAVLVGSLLFGEEVNAEKLFPMLLMIGGVVLVTAF